MVGVLLPMGVAALWQATMTARVLDARHLGLAGSGWLLAVAPRLHQPFAMQRGLAIHRALTGLVLLAAGLAGGTTARQFTEIFGPIPIDGVEIDPEIVEVGREYFAMNQPNLNVIVEDGLHMRLATDADPQS